MTSCDEQMTDREHPLNDFAHRWRLDGDYIWCRQCNRPQQVFWMLHDFRHRSDCRQAGAERNPWLTLNSLITAQINRAKPVCEAANAE